MWTQYVVAQMIIPAKLMNAKWEHYFKRLINHSSWLKIQWIMIQSVSIDCTQSKNFQNLLKSFFWVNFFHKQPSISNRKETILNNHFFGLQSTTKTHCHFRLCILCIRVYVVVLLNYYNRVRNKFTFEGIQFDKRKKWN